jgi:hypothetical protein
MKSIGLFENLRWSFLNTRTWFDWLHALLKTADHLRFPKKFLGELFAKFFKLALRRVARSTPLKLRGSEPNLRLKLQCEPLPVLPVLCICFMNPVWFTEI